LKRRTPLLVTTGSEAGGERTGAASGGGGGVTPRLLSFERSRAAEDVINQARDRWMREDPWRNGWTGCTSHAEPWKEWDRLQIPWRADRARLLSWFQGCRC